MLTIYNLHAKIEGRDILQGVNLVVPPGEIHAIMGPNGSGKSTLAHVLFGHPSYQVTDGTITFNGTDVQKMKPDARARLGMFLAFQRPVEVPGITAAHLLRAASQAKGDTPTSLKEFEDGLDAAFDRLHLDRAFATRSFNEGFSGGERKKMEVLAAVTLAPRLLVLDELDSGLDIDALRTVAEEVKRFVEEDASRSVLLITHYNRILKYLTPDVVHIFQSGVIERSGGAELAEHIEEHGYASA
ncbi:MAG: Fe-S cluster assembly ATPase SufC [Candidatus Kerfeldbacteria bacterium]|nr:Fe-S cluster assembly ATPase SufC [Candidatus Kerfeldbacteria bacterium]